MGLRLNVGTRFRNSGRRQWDDDQRNPDMPLNITFVVPLKRTHVADGLAIHNGPRKLPEGSLSRVGVFGYPRSITKRTGGLRILPDKIAEKLIHRRPERNNPDAIWLNPCV